MKYKSPRGVFDILPMQTIRQPEEMFRASELWQYVEETIRDVTRHFGYSEIRTPIFERTELFQRSVGESSDIVRKEMYSFEDRGERHLTLRPEGTAPVMRSFIQERMDQVLPEHKLFYLAPMFRYERPQAGRYRQHHQFGAEAIGNGAPEQDVELIDLLYTVYKELGLRNLNVKLNSIGQASCRKRYRKALLDYLEAHKADLSEDSKTRLEINPLRILDSKDEKDRAIVANAPSILDHLSEDCSSHFARVQELLRQLKIPFEIDQKLVRGLDYYNKTVFEVCSTALGAQDSIGGGGRYDGLLDQLNGPDLPAIGFGSGMERIIQTVLQQNPQAVKRRTPLLFLLPLGDAAKNRCFSILHTLRTRGIDAQMDFSGRKLGKVMGFADSIGAELVAVVGDSELEKDAVEIKVMATGEKIPVTLSQIAEELLALIATRRQQELGELAAALSEELGMEKLKAHKIINLGE